MKSEVPDSSNTIFIHSFLSAFKLAYDTTRVQYGDALWSLPFFMKHHHATAALNACIALDSKSHKRQKEGAVTPYCEAVN